MNDDEYADWLAMSYEEWEMEGDEYDRIRDDLITDQDFVLFGYEDTWDEEE